MYNKYIIHSHISEAKTRAALHYFSCDLEAVKIAELTGLSRNTVNKLLKALRLRIVEICDGIPFHAQRDDSMSRDEATSLFGLIQKDGKIHAESLENPSAGGHESDGNILMKPLGAYCCLLDFSNRKYFVTRSYESKFNMNHFENFWDMTEDRLSKFKGIPKVTQYLHLKECEFRFNYRQHDLYSLLLKSLRENPLKLT